jgi:hypothetical protein
VSSTGGVGVSFTGDEQGVSPASSTRWHAEQRARRGSTRGEAASGASAGWRELQRRQGQTGGAARADAAGANGRALVMTRREKE